MFICNDCLIKMRKAGSREKRAKMIDEINKFAKHKEQIGFGAILNLFCGAKELGVEDK